MKVKNNSDQFDLISKFRLNINQTKILFLLQRLIIKNDINLSL